MDTLLFWPFLASFLAAVAATMVIATTKAGSAYITRRRTRALPKGLGTDRAREEIDGFIYQLNAAERTEFVIWILTQLNQLQDELQWTEELNDVESEQTELELLARRVISVTSGPGWEGISTADRASQIFKDAVALGSAVATLQPPHRQQFVARVGALYQAACGERQLNRTQGGPC